MLQGEYSAILSIFIKLPFVIKIFVLSIFEWPFYTGFTIFIFDMVDIDGCQARLGEKVSVRNGMLLALRLYDWLICQTSLLIRK